jgi:lipoprotein NlpI
MTDHNRAIELWTGPNTFAARGVTRRYIGDVDGALSDFGQVIARVPNESALIHLWVWEMLMLRGSPGDREKATESMSGARTAAARNQWHQLIISTITGEVSSETLLAEAKDTEQRGEALYALGSRALVDGNNEEARRWFQRCCDLGAVSYTEFDLAMLHLRSPLRSDP